MTISIKDKSEAQMGQLKMFSTVLFNLVQGADNRIALSPTQQQTKPITLQVSVGVQVTGHDSPTAADIRAMLGAAYKSNHLVVAMRPPNELAVDLIGLLTQVYQRADIHVQIVSDVAGDGAMLVYEYKEG